MSKALREHEMLEPLDRLRRADEAAGAAPHRIELAGLRVDLAHGMAAADRADGRETRRASRPRGRRSETTRTICGMTSPARCTITVSPIAHVLARDLVLVVQRRVGDDDAADRHRLEPRDRRQRAGAADLDVDASSTRLALARRRTCARSPSAARASTKPSRSCSRAGRPCRRRRRCRSRASARCALDRRGRRRAAPRRVSQQPSSAD